MASASRAGVALQPLFVGRSDTLADPRWDTPVVTLGPGSRADPGSPVFTLDGRLAGLAAATEEEDAVILIPADQLMVSVKQMLSGAVVASGDLGITTQPLDARTARITGAPAGSVVAHVSPDGPSHDRLWVGDVVTAVNGQPVATPRGLDMRVARTPPGATLSVTVLRGGAYQTLPLVVGSAVQQAGPTVGSVRPESDTDLGLTLRTVSPQGSEVVRVRAGSAADVAGVQSGDLIVAVGRLRTPVPAQVTEAWGALAGGTPLFLGVERAGRPRAVVVEK
jgi:serine protease Do